ncbi:MAG TPA: tRNA (adenosine(37)-N6)-threonylcarbamoyltransferase complex ATPase subunit type 1 TsaE [Chthonomonadaceae bacterium]|nr:tRNA (adenosine(37)-N6)-threonylcarbamoyltransferase complex ATPase subunit type 1 TsaE [Chthonomonadaceae bacterium]
MNAAWRLRTPGDTQRFGEALGGLLFPGAVVALIGDVGAGKTTMVQAIARGMGIVEPVTSPTFALIHVYPGPLPLVHVDPYRLDRAAQLYDVGFLEYFAPDNVVAIEWADRLVEMLPSERLELRIGEDPDRRPHSAQSEPPRIVVADAYDEEHAALLRKLATTPGIAGLRPASEQAR